MLHIYKASAGSGKTFTLTKQYLTLLLGDRNPMTGKWRLRSSREAAHRHILAITFTNKATQEMTRRIISQLAILAGRENDSPGARSPYADDFIKLFNTDEQSLRELASEILDDLLADFAFFHVSTIDAFFQNVLRIFAREIEMPDNFRLELDNASTISLGVNEMFNSLNLADPADPLRRRERSWMSEWLSRHMERMFEAGESVNFFSRSSSLYSGLITTFTLLLDETFHINSDIISAYLNEVERIDAFQRAIDKQASGIAAELRAMSTAIMQYGDFAQISRYIKPCITDWAAGTMRLPSPTVIKAIDSPKDRYYKQYFQKGAAPDLDLALTRLCAAASRFGAIAKRDPAIHKALTPLGLLGCLLRHIAAFCKDNNVIMLSDTNSLLRQIINDDDTPFVYERLGYYLRHFLIDEFQDTSRMQWDNLRPLIIESLSHSHESLVIGDEKQCIYRFRNSDPELLGHVITDTVESIYGPEAVSVEGNTIEQNNNWRSSAEVVRFNNSIFHAISDIAGCGSYGNVIQQISPKRGDAIPGYVKVMFEPPHDDTADDADGHGDGEEDGGDQSFAIESTVAEVDRMLSAGYRPHDIAILVRTHREGEKIIARLLDCKNDESWRHGAIEVKSSDAVGISSSPAVRMIIEILRLTQIPHMVSRLADNPDGSSEVKQEVNPAYRRARLLYCYQYYLHAGGDDPGDATGTLSPDDALAAAIEAIRRDENGLDNGAGLPPMHATLAQILSFAADATSGATSGQTADDNPDGATVTCLTLPAIVDKIISRYVKASALPDETAYLTAFQDLVYDYCSHGDSDIRTFLSWWDRGGCRSSLSSTSEADAINVMTIHQSKGLEYPCVILPFADSKMVAFSSASRRSFHWMPVTAADFPGIPPEIIPPMLPVEFTKGVCDIDIFKAEAQKFVNEQIVDNLNVAYVAFTRAVNELIVIAPRNKNSDSGSNQPSEMTLDNLLRRAITSLTGTGIAGDASLDSASREWVLPLGDLFDGNTLVIGHPTAPSGKRDNGSKLPVVTLPAYSPYVNERLVTLTEADIELFDYDNPRHRGDFLHRVLSHVRHRGDLARAMRRAAYRAHLSAPQRAECEQILSSAVNDPRAQRWFEGYERVYIEKSIVGTDIHRPDRVVIQPDGTVEVIDYKFGDDNSSYTRQLQRYMRLLRDAGYQSVKGFLWFPATATIRQV